MFFPKWNNPHEVLEQLNGSCLVPKKHIYKRYAIIYFVYISCFYVHVAPLPNQLK